MRPYLFFALVVLSFFASAQTAENQNFRYTYVTYAQGYIVLSVENLTPSCSGGNGTATQQNLEARFRWRSGGKDSSLFFFAGEIRQVMLPFSGGNITVQAKTVSSCNTASNGPWISISLTALAIREDDRLKPPARAVPPGRVKIVAISGAFCTEMSETEFQKVKEIYKRYYFILRPGKVKEVMF